MIRDYLTQPWRLDFGACKSLNNPPIGRLSPCYEMSCNTLIQEEKEEKEKEEEEKSPNAPFQQYLVWSCLG